MRQRRGASRRDDPPFGLGQLCQPPAHAVHQLVQVDVMPRSLLQRLFDLRQGLRSAEDGIRSLAVDHRLNADALVDIGLGLGRCQHREPGQQACQKALASGAEQLPPIADESVCHYDPSLVIIINR